MVKYLATDECMLCGKGIDREVDRPTVLPEWVSGKEVLVFLGPSGVFALCKECAPD